MPRKRFDGLEHSATEDSCERLRRTARLSQEADAPRIRAELRANRGNHRRSAAARGTPRLMVGNAAQPAREDAATRGLPRRRLYRDKARGRQERAVQADGPEHTSSPRKQGPIATVVCCCIDGGPSFCDSKPVPPGLRLADPSAARCIDAAASLTPFGRFAPRADVRGCAKQKIVLRASR